jgi:UDP-glucose 4-epimerase
VTDILTTGGAGFIGSNPVRRCAAHDEVGRVVILDDLSTGARANLDGVDVEFHEGSVTDASALREAARGVDTVVHLAAPASGPESIADPERCHAVNATGTLLLRKACRREGVEHVPAVLSSAVYGANPAPVEDERQWVRPMSPYAVSKPATEQYLLAYQTCYDPSTVAFRFSNVYGLGQAAGHV